MTPQRRIRLTFLVLVSLAVVAVGTAGRALAWPSSPRAGIAVALAGIVAAVAIGLAVRMLVVTEMHLSQPGAPDEEP